MKKILFALSVAALMACSNSGVASGTVINQPTSSDSNGSSSNSIGSSSNSTINDGFLKGVWLRGEPDIDEGDVYNVYYCFTHNGKAYQVNDDDMVDERDVSWYSGDYTISGNEMSMNFDTRAEFIGDAGATPTDASTWSSESMQGDDMSITVTYTTSGNAVVMTYKEQSATFTSTTSVPAYMTSIPCQ